MFLTISPLLLASGMLFAGILVGYLSGNHKVHKLKKKLLDLEQEMMDRDAEILRREKREASIHK